MIGQARNQLTESVPTPLGPPQLVFFTSQTHLIPLPKASDFKNYIYSPLEENTMSISPIHYIPPSRGPQILSTKIHRIIASPHVQVPVETTKRTNHWCLYLSTSETTCVTLDCQPSHTVPSSVLVGGSKAYVILSELSAPAGQDALLEFAVGMDVRAGVKVGDVVDVLVEGGRERYEFDADGVGCRFWVTEVLELLLRVGVLLDGQQVEGAKGMVKRLWPEGTGLELDRGVYY